MKEHSSFASYLSLNEVKGWLVIMKKIVFCTILAAIVGIHTAALADTKVTFDDEGTVIYKGENKTDGSDMYIGLFDRNGILRDIRKNWSEIWFEVSDNIEYTVKAFNWNGMEPKGEAQEFTQQPHIYVLSTAKPVNGNSAVSVNSGTVSFADKEAVMLDSEITLADASANKEAKGVCKYLKAVGKSQSVLFGQQNYLHHKAGSGKLSYSDIYDITSDYAAVTGIDTLSLTGDELSAVDCNKRYGTSYAETAEGNVQAAAYLTNKAVENGAIVTLSSHMPNFADVTETGKGNGYAQYDFSGYNPYPHIYDEDTANNILNGGKHNAKFNAFLDMIADYISQVNGTVIFRPFHENTGSWFWWGADYCTPEQYKSIYAYTVNYLNKTKNLHNILYCYSPGIEFANETDFAERYPGDEYVDILGFDMYNDNPDGSDIWLDRLSEKLAILDSFAAAHNKITALTETGIRNDTADGDSQTALLRKGNPDKDWYNRVLDRVSVSSSSYFMVWSNFSETDGFYTPYVKQRTEDGFLYGHEMLDGFINFYNDSRTIFASDQKTVIDSLK